MKVEIINPSDECYLESDDVRVLQACGLFLGNGQYALNDEKGETILPIFMFGGADEFIAETFPEGFNKFVDDNLEKIRDCFKTFKYARERTSLNNIGAAAKKLCEKCEERINAINQ